MKDIRKSHEQLIEEIQDLRRNVSELERSLSVLTHSDQMIIDSMGDHVIVIDASTYEIVLANKTARQQLYMENNSSTSLKCFEAFHHRDVPCQEPREPCPLSRVRATKTPARVVHVHQSPEEKKTYVEIIATPVFDREGDVFRIIESSRDITDRIQLEEEQEKLIAELREALAKIKTLKGLIPVCAWCKKARDDKGYWESLEDYIRDRSDADFTHGICPECLKKVQNE